MCGILGLYSNSLIQKEIISSSLELMRHRGPDDRGLDFFELGNKSLVLGQTRLSIIDLSSGGHQPFFDESKRYCLVFNGEIYNYKELRSKLKSRNYKFKTESDTEVLLYAWIEWREEVLTNLKGMFAFSIYDSHLKKITIVRDAFGIKPLLYFQSKDKFAFASEKSALLNLLNQKIKLNAQSAYDYLVFGSYDDKVETFHDGIINLKPGHFIEIDLKSNSRLKQVKWWFPSIKLKSKLSFKDASEELREIFLNNVKLHLRSDVPVGAALSGGIDSSAVVCAMRYLEPKIDINTFTYVEKGSKIDEEKWADIINHKVNAIPNKIKVDVKDLVNDIDDMIKAQGEPFGGTSIYAQYRVFKAAKEKGIIVTLDGQGADELLAGYDGYPHGYIHSLIDKNEYYQLICFLNNWSKWPGRNMSSAFKMLGSSLTPEMFRSFAYKLLNKNPIPNWIDKDYFIDNELKTIPPRFSITSNEGFERRLVEQLRSALQGYGLSKLLRHGDRNSMKWSIESRVPFLTIEMAEFLLTLPEDYLLSKRGETKHIFKSSMRGIVPDIILDRKDKIGFETPEGNWLRNIKDEISNWINIEQEKVPFLNLKFLKKEVINSLNPKNKYHPIIWRMINYCRWVQLIDK